MSGVDAFIEAKNAAYENAEGSVEEAPEAGGSEPTADGGESTDGGVGESGEGVTPEEPAAPTEEPVTPTAGGEVAQEGTTGGADEAEWKRRIAEIQSIKDREIAEARAKLEAYEAILNSNEPLDDTPPPPVPDDQIDAMVAAAPVDTFRMAMEQAPQELPRVLASIREQHGEAMYQQAQAALNTAMAASQQAQLEARIAQIEAPQRMQQEFAQAIGAVQSEFGDEFNELRADVAERIKANGNRLYEHASVASFVREQFLEAYREKVKNTPPPDTAPTPAFVETGTPGQAPPEKSYAELKREAMIREFKRGRYSPSS